MSFLNQVAMSDQLYQQQQKEREDREAELLRRKFDQAKMQHEEYMRPFETKELLAQYEDTAAKRQDERDQRNLGKFAVPYEPKTGINEDGTRQLDITVPFAPAVAGLAAAGLGTFGQPEGFVRPFRDQAVPDSRKYNTPEEIKKKADTEDAHKKSLELAGARKAAARTPAATGTTQQKQYIELVKKAYIQNENEFQANNRRRPNEAEIKELSERAVSAARIQIEAMQLQPQSAPQPTPRPPATKSPSKSPAPPATGRDPMEDLESLVVPPTPKSANLQETQASNAIHTPAAPPASFDESLSQLGVTVQPPHPNPLPAPSVSPASPGSAAAVPSAQQPTRQQADPAVSLEDSYREIMKKQWQASQSELRGIESFPRVASIVEQQLQRRLTDDEKGYLAENIEDFFQNSGTEFNLENGTYRNLSGEIKPISEIITSGFDFAASQAFAGFAGSRDNALRKVAKWLQPLGVSEKVIKDL